MSLAMLFTDRETIAQVISDLCPGLAVTLMHDGIQPVLLGVAIGCEIQAFVA